MANFNSCGRNKSGVGRCKEKSIQIIPYNQETGNTRKKIPKKKTKKPKTKRLGNVSN